MIIKEMCWPRQGTELEGGEIGARHREHGNF